MEAINEFDEFQARKNESDYQHMYDSNKNLFNTILYITMPLRMVFSLLLYFIIRKSMMPRTRTTLLLLVWAGNDFIHAIYNFMRFITYDAIRGLDSLECIIGVGKDTLEFLGMAIIFVMLADWIMESQKISDRTLLILVFVTTFILGIFFVTLSLIINYHFYFLLTNETIELILFITLIIKEFLNCYRRCKETPEKDQVLRLGVARIYVYSIVVASGFYSIFSSWGQGWWAAMLIVDTTVEDIRALLILLYIACRERRARVCLQNVMKCKGIRYEDAGVKFSTGNESQAV